MADIVVIVGLDAGDDFTTLSAALASVLSDLTTLADNYVIQLRDDQVHPGMTLPNPTTSASNRLVIEAFPGDETDGSGNGAKLEQDRSAGVVRVGGIDYLDLNGIYFNQLGTSRCLLVTGATSQNTRINNCLAKSISGDTLEVSNGSGHFLGVDNSILVNTTGGLCLDFGSGTDNTTKTINRLTAIGGTTRTVDRVSSTVAQSRRVNYTNCLLFSNGSQTFPTLSSTFNPFDSDFNATGDALGTLNSLTTGFNNRVITDDIEDPNGAIPNYNLKSTSTLIGAGSDGGNVGATLGSVTPPVGNSISVSSEMPSMTSALNINYELPDYDASISSTMPSMVSSLSIDYSIPGNSSAITSVMPSMQSVLTASHDVPQFSVGVVSTMPSMVSASSLTNLPPGINSLIDSAMPSMASAASVVKSNPQHSASITSEMPSMNSLASFSVNNPGYNASIASTMPSMSSTLMLSISEPVEIDLSIASIMPSMSSSLRLVNGEVAEIGNITLSFVDDFISVEYLQSKIQINYEE